MVFQRFARSALSTASLVSSTSTTTTTSTVARVFGAPFAARPLSTTASRLAPPRSPPHPSWPPQRDAPTAAPTATASPSAPSASTASSSSLTTSNDPLKDLYSSDNPAQWAAWSSDDFQQRHGASAGGRQQENKRPFVKLKPITGRTVHVGGSTDPAQAFLFLNILCRRNKVAADFRDQKYYERAGIKRKRLAWERKYWRFRRNYFKAITRVETLAKQGW
ncbi:hypothetical protein SEUCBS139899_008491 [Sporothrix eucalyptigena]|uniref:Ribosomal protein S21 n=1 Tax=Sporothrix eucalyptigena TaxID=1812306 RepID=A0ABP0C9M8_9PEZI